MNEIPEHDWPRVFELLDTALELAPAERDDWLEELQSSGEVLLPALRGLLASRAQIETRGFLAAPVPLAAFAESAALRVLAPGGIVGAYRLIREIAAGGMGTVWLAERADGLIKRHVALKLPHAGPHSRLFAERFARERTILAALEHPHIARLYDAGVTVDGQPFIALEYVEGETVTAYCDRLALDVTRRVALFLEVLHAVQHAHGRLIVHRDLKPNNMLVAKDGQVKLLDFGIAKLLQAEGEDEAQLTQLGGHMATPAYASPEQITGSTIGIASDVYSAGVVLYELLTGLRPYDVRPGARAELEAAIVGGRTVPADRARISAEAAAARATSPRRLAALLTGDLGTVLAKALKTSPVERYVTAEAFAQDLESVLRNEPIRARRDSAWYRVRKFIVRNRYPVAGVAAIVASLALGLALTLWKAEQARQQAARAEEIKRFILSVFTSANPLQGGGADLRAVDLLVRARERIEKELVGRDAEQVELLCTVGVSLSNLSALAESRAAYESALKIGPPDGGRQTRVNEGCQVDYAMVLLGSDELAAAETVLSRAEPRLRAAAPSVELGRLLLARSALGRINGNVEDALAASEESVAVTRAAAGADSREYVNTLMQLGRIRYAAGKLEAAVAAAEEGLEKLPKAVGTADHPDMPLFRVLRASALSDLGRHDEAVHAFEQAMPGIARAFGVESQEHVVDLYYYALAHRQRGDLRQAMALMRESIELGRKGGLAKELVSLTANAHAILHLMARQGDAARQAALDAIELARASVPVIESRVTEAQQSLAFADALRGDVDAARRALAARIEATRKAGGTAVATPLHYLGEVELLAGRPADALPLLSEAAELTEAGVPRRRWWLPAVKTSLARALLELQRVDEAASQLRSALDLFDRQQPVMNPAHAEAHTLLARVYLLRGESNEAVAHAAKADAFWREFDALNRWSGEAAYWHARTLATAGRAAESRAAFDRARSILSTSPLPIHRVLAVR